jgi:transposase
MDLGKRQSHACWLTEDGEIRHLRIRSTREALTMQFGGRRGRILIEATSMSEWVARLFESLGGWEVVVADPNFAPMYAERTRRVKTDRRDAEALMRACLRGNYRPVHRLSDEARLLRMTVKVRKGLVRARAKAAVQAKALLTPHGIQLETGRPCYFPERILAAEVPPALRFELAPLVDLVTHLNDPISRTEERLEELAKQDPCARRLATVPGVGPITAACWIAALDTPDRFANGEQVVSYLGLVPREWSSSEMRLQGRITKVGPSDLRELLVEGAWHVLNHPTPDAASLRAWAQRIAARRGRNKAVVALARRMARILFVIWRDGTSYSPERTRVKKEKVAVG